LVTFKPAKQPSKESNLPTVSPKFVILRMPNTQHRFIGTEGTWTLILRP